MSSNGISHQVSCPYTPEQNGISERKNRHIRETAVTMLQTASLSAEFWYHACALATYLINRMPTSILAMSSPFEVLYKRLPCLELLRVFGCACYPLMTPYRTNKLQPKTVKCVFIGFAAGYKGYICYNPVTKKYIVSRHVFFNEEEFPFATGIHKVHAGTTSISPMSSPASIQPCFTFTQTNVQQPILVPHTSSLSCTLSTGQAGQVSHSLEPHNMNSDSNAPSDDCTAHVSVSGDTNMISDTSSPSVSDCAVPSPSAFDSNVHTSIMFNEIEGQVQVQSESGVGISVVLDCAPHRPVSQVSEANILHPVEGLANSVVNDHSMLTRSKRGICQKKCFLSLVSSSSVQTDGSSVEPYNYKSALKIPVEASYARRI